MTFRDIAIGQCFWIPGQSGICKQYLMRIAADDPTEECPFPPEAVVIRDNDQPKNEGSRRIVCFATPVVLVGRSSDI